MRTNNISALSTEIIKKIKNTGCMKESKWMLSGYNKEMWGA
jgi:hypothetical protein